MEIIINPDRVAAHKVEPYSFKKVDSDGYVEGQEKAKQIVTKELISEQAKVNLESENESVETQLKPESLPSEQEEDKSVEEPTIPTPPPVHSDTSDMYKKIDEMSTSVIKMEMRLEKQQEEFNEKIEEERERSLAEGIEKGRAEAEQSLEGELKNRLEQLSKSIEKIEYSAKNYDEILGSLEKELTTVAVDIAKEVIAKEVEDNSSAVAISLANKLLEEVKEASETIIRVNPIDNDDLKQHLMANSKVKIESDSAISPGGVIIMSNVGNINGDIQKRYEQVRKNTLESD